MVTESISRPSIPQIVEELRASSALSLRSSRKALARFDRALAFAVVLAASSSVYYLGMLLLDRWQLR